MVDILEAGGVGRDSFVACAIRAAADRLAVARTLDDLTDALDALAVAVAPFT
jgi:hypothetical protein